MDNTQLYNSRFYNYHEPRSLRSAGAIVPIVLALAPVASVVDIGCGIGAWLKAFRDNGVSDLLGLDGSYIDRKRLLIDDRQFWPVDLATDFKLDRRFDLAISLEAGEHLPQSRARSFVGMLTEAAP